MSASDLMAQIRAKRNTQPVNNGSGAPDAVALMESMIGKSLRPEVRQQVEAFGLLRGDDGTLRFDDVQLTSVGLVIPNDGVSQETASRLLDMLLRLEGSIQWLLGDILAYGERTYGETYQEMAIAYGRESQTLRDWCWVARAFPNLSSRKDKLTFTHHKFLAHLDENGKVLWLDYTVAMSWSVAKMRAFLGLLDVFDIERQREWLEIVLAERLTADQLRARLGSAGGTALEVVEHDRDLVGQMAAAKRLVSTVERYGTSLTGAGKDTVRDVVKSARAMRALADEILEKHGQQ